jgi:hypothetical protein
VTAVEDAETAWEAALAAKQLQRAQQIFTDVSNVLWGEYDNEGNVVNQGVWDQVYAADAAYTTAVEAASRAQNALQRNNAPGNLQTLLSNLVEARGTQQRTATDLTEKREYARLLDIEYQNQIDLDMQRYMDEQADRLEVL